MKIQFLLMTFFWFAVSSCSGGGQSKSAAGQSSNQDEGSIEIEGNDKSDSDGKKAGQISKLRLAGLKEKYAVGDVISIKVTLQIENLSANLALAGSTDGIRLLISIGTNRREASCVVGTTSNIVDCKYAIQQEDDGLLAFNELVIGSSSGTIKIQISEDLSNPNVTIKTANTETANPEAPAPVASSIAVSGSNNQIGQVGSTLDQKFIASVFDASGNPIANINVSWTIASGSGSFAQENSISDANGQAISPQFTLPFTAGQNTISASIGSGIGKSVEFTVTAIPGSPALIAIVSGDSQSKTVASTSDSMEVIVKDAHDNVVPNAGVTWAVVSGGGSLIGSATTNSGADGKVSKTFYLGTAVGANSVTATLDSDSSKSVTFSATSTPAAAASITVVSGSGQSKTVGSTSDSLVVVVRDTYNNVVSNAGVTWAVASGGGSLIGSASTSSGADGTVSKTFYLGTTAGANSVTATLDSDNTKSVTFSATGIPGAAASIAVVSGSGQSKTVAATSDSMVVVVKDIYDNVVSNAGVTWAVASGDGSLIGSATTNSGADGTVSKTFYLGTTASANSVTATLDSDNSKSVTFSATGVAGAAASISVVSGSGQSKIVASASDSMVAIVKDGYDNPVSGVNVIWAIGSGGGSLVGSANATTASDGKVSNTITLGTTAGTNTVSVTIAADNTKTTSFTLTGNAGSAASMSAFSGNNQQGYVGDTSNDIVGLVVDEHGNPVSGVSVNWSIVSGSGVLVGSSTATTDSNGKAANQITFPTTPGTTLVNLEVAGDTSISTLFNEYSNAGPASVISIVSGNSQSKLTGEVSDYLVAVVKDSYSNPVPDVDVVWQVASGGGSLETTGTSTSDADGNVSNRLTLGSSAGTNSVSLELDADSSVNTSFSLTGYKLHLNLKGLTSAFNRDCVKYQVVLLDPDNNPVSAPQNIALTISSDSDLAIVDFYRTCSVSSTLSHDSIAISAGNMATYFYAQPQASVTSDTITVSSNSSYITGTSSITTQFSTPADASGAPDTTFNSTGKNSHTVSAYGNGSLMRANPDGTIIQAGTHNAYSGTIRVIKWKADGTLDTSFGSSGSYTKTLSTFGAEYGAYASINTLATQLNGGILVGAIGGSKYQFFRLTAQGALDTSFGTSGLAKITVSTSTAIIADLKENPLNGKIYVGGFATDTSGSQVNRIARVNSNGSLDTTFGTNGIVTIPSLSGSTSDQLVGFNFDKNNNILVFGLSTVSSSYRGTLTRLTANGALDTTFGTTGQVSVANGGSYWRSLWQGDLGSVEFMKDNSILVSSYGANAYVTIGRFSSDGSLTTSFGTSGYLTTNIGHTNWNNLGHASTILVAADSKFFVNAFGKLNKYTAAGAADTSFATSGQYVPSEAFQGGERSSIAYDGRVLIGGAGHYDQKFTILRLAP